MMNVVSCAAFRVITVWSSAFLTGCVYLSSPLIKSDQFDALPVPAATTIGITHVTLNADPALNKIFWAETRAVISSLPKQPGYLGHRIRKKLFSNEAWTMTIWQDEQSLKDFVRSHSHSQAITNGVEAVKAGRFARMTVQGTSAIPTWKQAEMWMQQHGRSLY